MPFIASYPSNFSSPHGCHPWLVTPSLLLVTPHRCHPPHWCVTPLWLFIPPWMSPPFLTSHPLPHWCHSPSTDMPPHFCVTLLWTWMSPLPLLTCQPPPSLHCTAMTVAKYLGLRANSVVFSSVREEASTKRPLSFHIRHVSLEMSHMRHDSVTWERISLRISSIINWIGTNVWHSQDQTHARNETFTENNCFYSWWRTRFLTISGVQFYLKSQKFKVELHSTLCLKKGTEGLKLSVDLTVDYTTSVWTNLLPCFTKGHRCLSTSALLSKFKQTEPTGLFVHHTQKLKISRQLRQGRTSLVFQLCDHFFWKKEAMVHTKYIYGLFWQSCRSSTVYCQGDASRQVQAQATKLAQKKSIQSATTWQNDRHCTMNKWCQTWEKVQKQLTFIALNYLQQAKLPWLFNGTAETPGAVTDLECLFCFKSQYLLIDDLHLVFSLFEQHCLQLFDWNSNNFILLQRQEGMTELSKREIKQAETLWTTTIRFFGSGAAWPQFCNDFRFRGWDVWPGNTIGSFTWWHWLFYKCTLSNEIFIYANGRSDTNDRHGNLEVSHPLKS